MDVITQTYQTQQARILEFLRSGKPLSPFEALKRFGCLRLSAQVFELKKKGWDIRCDMEYKYDNEGRKIKRYGVYTLIGEKND